MKTQSGYIYCVQMGDSGPVKIGYASTVSNVRRRLESLQSASVEPLQLRAVFRGSQPSETKIHRELSSDRLRGEWFQASPAVDAVIARGEIVEDLPIRKPRSYTRMPEDRAVVHWKNQNLTYDEALQRMTGWTGYHARLAFGLRSNFVKPRISKEQAQRMQAKSVEARRDGSVIAEWKSNEMKAERERWASVWRDPQYANADEAAAALPAEISNPWTARAIFGGRDPSRKGVGGRPKMKTSG